MAKAPVQEGSERAGDAAEVHTCDLQPLLTGFAAGSPEQSAAQMKLMGLSSTA